MAEQKYKKIYTQQELDEYMRSLVRCKDIDQAWRTLGYINASAYKGSDKSEEQQEYNQMVYAVKEAAICKLAKRGGKLYFVSKKNSLGTYILYVRLNDGVQLSFHVFYSMRGKNLAFKSLEKYMGNCMYWEGVEDSYRYNGNEYREILSMLKKKKKIAIEKFKEHFGKRVGGVQNFITQMVSENGYVKVRVRIPKRSLMASYKLEDLI